jgi:hypothetical protein
MFPQGQTDYLSIMRSCACGKPGHELVVFTTRRRAFSIDHGDSVEQL